MNSTITKNKFNVRKQVSYMNEVSMAMVYKEILEVKKKLETIEDIIIPSEEVSEECLEEIEQLKAESLKGEYIEWADLKKELSL
jgi:hypothetical protein